MRFALLLSVAAISLAGPVCAADEKQESIGQPTEVKASPDLKISEKEAQDMLRKGPGRGVFPVGGVLRQRKRLEDSDLFL